MAATESLQVDYQHGWHIVDLDLLDGLFVVDAAIAVPGVGLRKLLWPVELPETVIDADTFAQLLALIRLRQRLVLGVVERDEPVEAGVKRPALLVVKLDQQLKLKVIALERRGSLDVSLAVRLRSFICFASALFGLLGCLCFLLAGGLGLLASL